MPRTWRSQIADEVRATSMMKPKPMSMEVGDKFRHPRFGLCHVRGLIDDQVVFRWWRRRHQGWEYDCEPLWLLKETIEWDQKLSSQ